MSTEVGSSQRLAVIPSPRPLHPLPSLLSGANTCRFWKRAKVKEMPECGGEHKIYILLSGMKQTERHKGVTQKSTTSGLFFSGFGAD